MVELDGDDVRISSRGKLAERDIVQVKPKSCLSQGKCPSPSSQANVIPPFKKILWKGALEGAPEWSAHQSKGTGISSWVTLVP